MNSNDIEKFTHYLFSAALKKCGNFEDAEDLAGEVILAALNYHGEIQDLKSWLSSVLNHKYYDMLRRKYKLPTISIQQVPEDTFLYEDNRPAEHEFSPTSEEIRREVAYLSGKYREVIVRHYLNGEKVQAIADSLSIPKGTVLSRLSTAREQMKKGFDSMERFEKQSYEPERLEISCNGSSGLHDEPWSLVADDLMKQNILIAAYEKPVTCLEIALALGIPTAYIERAVNDLVKSELMQQNGNKVFTDFIIFTPEYLLSSLDIQIAFAKKHYTAIRNFLSEFLDNIMQKVKTFALQENEQQKLAYYCLLHLFSKGDYQTMQKILPSKEEFPLRPDGGRWIAMGNRYPADFDFSTFKAAKYCYGGERIASENNLFDSTSVSFHVYDTQPDLNKYQQGPLGIGDDILMKLLYIIHKDIPFHCTGMDPLILRSIPHLVECGVLDMVNGKPKVAVPVISKGQYEELLSLFTPYVTGFVDLLEPLVRTILPKLKVKLPAHLKNRVAEFRTYTWYSLPMATIKEAIERNEFPLEQQIPPMVLVIEN